MGQIPGMQLPPLNFNPTLAAGMFGFGATHRAAVGPRAGRRRVSREHHVDAEAGLMALPISYNVRNVIVRWKVTLLALAGISLVVGVLIALTAMANGFSKALAATGSADNAIVTQRGSGSELSSGMSRDNASMIMVDSRVKRDAQGRPMASPEMIIVASLPKRGEVTEVNVTVRGVTQMAFSVRQNVKITEGRNFTPGLYELVVGKKAAERYQGLEVGGSIKLQRKTWQVVGIFTSEGSGFESEIWGDYDALAPVFNRADGYQSLTLRLADPSHARRVQHGAEGQPQHAAPDGQRAAVLRRTGRPDRQRPDRRSPCLSASSWASAPCSAR